MATDLTGQTIADGKYTITRLIGHGGGGAVYEARQATLDKHVALKVLANELARDEKLVKRFLREAQTATRVEHENVVQLFDVGPTGTGTAYIAMELLKGEPLSDLIEREAPLSWRRAKTIALQICRAMHVAHAASVIHRDLKPDNCFRVKRGANADFIKLLDFGLAKVFGESKNPYDTLTSVGTTFGTPEYMAPEQCEGDPVDHRVDIYALGIVIYELLTGTVPFEVEDNRFMDVLTAHIEQAPAPPSTHVPGGTITPEMDAFVMKALAKDPDDRYSSMKKMAEALLAVPEPGVNAPLKTLEHSAGMGIDISSLQARASPPVGAEASATALGPDRETFTPAGPRPWLEQPNAKLVVGLAALNVVLGLALALSLL